MSAPPRTSGKKGTPITITEHENLGSSDLEQIIEERTAELHAQVEALNNEITELRRIEADRKRMEEALQESEEKFRMLIQSTQDGILLNDRQGVILEWNSGMERITGIPKKEALGCTLSEIATRCAPEDRKTENMEQWVLSTIAEMNHKAISSSGNPFVELTIQRSDGSNRTIEAKNFQFTSRGRVFYGAVIRDSTERKQIEDTIHESEEKYRTLVEMSPDAIFIHQQGRIVYVNPAALHQLGASSPEELIGRDILDIIHPDFHPIVQHNIQDDLKGVKTPPTELQMIRLDGTLATFEGRGSRILYHRTPAIQVVVRDITERKRAELRLREYAENLRRSNEDLKLFTSIAAHDLQEPVRGIVAFSQLLLNQCKEGGYPLTEKYLRIIENAGLRMHVLVDNLRKYSGVGAHAKPLEPTNMETILSNALNNLQLVIQETQTCITRDPLPMVLADGTQITQVFQNMIDNAMKFRREGVSPNIHISVSRLDGMWRFAVQDNGIGIPPEHFEKIFILFERLHRRDAYPGTGLGLALCKRIIERHGGQIWVESEVGKGSTFYFTLPTVPS
jgi:PAS domain S-box-containing protein